MTTLFRASAENRIAHVPMDPMSRLEQGSVERRGGEFQECGKDDDHGEHRQRKQDQESDKLDSERQPMARVADLRP